MLFRRYHSRNFGFADISAVAVAAEDGANFQRQKGVTLKVSDTERASFINKMAENLPTLRTKLGLTQEELGKMIGVSRSTIIMFEKMQRQMTWSTFLSLILIFSKNSDTNKMLTALGIYTSELESILEGK